MRFSANLGFLWADLALPDAIRAAKAAGFDAVECHWQYAVPAADVRAALDNTRLAMIGLNTRRGRPGENGLSALPGREAEARAAIEEAVAYATAIGARGVHVVAGVASEQAAHAAFASNLRFACDAAAPHGITILIESLNRHDAPGYFLSTTDQARGIITAVAGANLRLMFDCYHVQRTEGDLGTRLADLWPVIGHIQFASVLDRGPPDHNEVDYVHVFDIIAGLGHTGPRGAEYKPVGPTGDSLGWLATLRATR